MYFDYLKKTKYSQICLFYVENMFNTFIFEIMVAHCL